MKSISVELRASEIFVLVLIIKVRTAAETERDKSGMKKNQLGRRLCPVKIYLIMGIFCSTSHIKISIVVIWVEVSLSFIGK
jgi:hypothetical protein